MKIIIFTSDSRAISSGLRTLVEGRKSDVIAIVLVSQLKGDIIKKLKSFLKYLKKTGVLFIFYKLYDGILCNDAAKIAETNNIPLMHTNDVNSPEFIKKLRNMNPDINLSFFTQQIFKKEIIAIPKRGTLNMHGSLLPHYKGAAQYFWYLHNNDKEGGVTVHYMDENLDTGDIVVQEKFSISDNDTMSSVHKKIAETGAKAAIKSLNLIESKKAKRIPQKKEKSEYLRLPTGGEIKEFRKRGLRMF